MKDSEPSKSTLMKELQTLRERNRELEGALAAPGERDRFSSIVLDAMSEIVLLMDTDLRIQWANRVAIEKSGLSSDALYGQLCHSAWHGRDEVCEDCPVHRALQIGKPCEGEMLSPTGRQWFIRGYPVMNGQGQLVGAAEIVLDITERKAVEDAVKRSEEQFRRLSEAAFEGIIIHREGRILEANSAFCQMTGYERKEIASMPVLGLAAPESHDLIMKKVAAGHDKPYEIIGRHKDGRLRPMELVGKNITYKGQAARVTAIRDIYERKQAENALRESEERYRKLVEASPDAITLSSLDHQLIMANQQAARHFGVESVEELKAEIGNVLSIIDPECHDLALQKFEETIEKGGTSYIEYKLRRRDGSAYPAEVSTAVVRDSDGNPQAIIGIIRDITERKRVEGALRESEELYRTLVNTFPDGIALTDLDGRLIMTNEAGARLYGCENSDEMLALGLGALDLVAPLERPRAQENARGAQDQGTIRGVEYQLTRKDGSTYPAELSASVVPDIDGQTRAFIGVIRDITERKRAQEEREKLQAQIQHAQKLESLGVLAGGIAHDFNNLLMGILGNASLALLDLPERSPAQTYIQKIEKTGQHAAELTKQMLAYSGKGKFVVQAIKLSMLVEEMSHLLAVSISKKVTLRYDFEADLPYIEADATQIRQVVMNLITNASEATGDEGGIVTIRTGAIVADRDYLATSYLDEDLPEGGYVFLEVSDTGCGMDSATRARIFDPFFTTKFTGRGLGLAAVLGIVRGHQGAIRVYTEPGRGTTFKVMLRALESGPKKSVQSPLVHMELKGGEKVLVVDDESTVRDVTRSMLLSAGFQVLEAADGMEALDIYRHQADQIVVVILDTTMPRMDGAETFRELRRIRSGVRVILSSGYNEQDATNRFVGKGLAGFIQKPYRLKELLDKIKEVLGK